MKSDLEKIKKKLEKEINQSTHLKSKRIDLDSFYIVSQEVFNPSGLNMHIYNIKGKISAKSGLPQITYKVDNPHILTPTVIAISVALLPAIILTTIKAGVEVIAMSVVIYLLIMSMMYRAALRKEEQWRNKGETEMKRVLDLIEVV